MAFYRVFLAFYEHILLTTSAIVSKSRGIIICFDNLKRRPKDLDLLFFHNHYFTKQRSALFQGTPEGKFKKNKKQYYALIIFCELSPNLEFQQLLRSYTSYPSCLKPVFKQSQL